MTYYLASVVILFLVLLLIVIKLYFKFTTGWCRSQKCLVGKTTLITGANAGLGYETAVDFAKRGARVILAGRNIYKLEEAKTKIISETCNNDLVVKVVDMLSLESVRKFAEDINKTEKRLDILVNNAGIIEGDKHITDDGLPYVLQVNHLSPFLLTNLLLGLLKRTDNSRIVNVASKAASCAVFNIKKIDDANITDGVYPISKLCNILFTIELASKLAGTTVTTYSVHPGVVATKILINARQLFRYFMAVFGDLFLKNSLEGAQTQIYCSVANGIEKYNGEHFSDCKRISPYLTVMINRKKASELWLLSEKLVNLKETEKQY